MPFEEQHDLVDEPVVFFLGLIADARREQRLMWYCRHGRLRRPSIGSRQVRSGKTMRTRSISSRKPCALV